MMDDPNYYHDYCQVTEANEGTILGPFISSSSTSDHNNNYFPSKLHYMLQELEKDGMSHIISWQPHGRCFKVHQPEELVETILHRWFSQSKLTSFHRQLNIYGFRRIVAGVDNGAYYHELFLRGKFFLARRIARMNRKGNGHRRPNAEIRQHNFYAMRWLPETTPSAVATLPPPQNATHSPIDDDVKESRSRSVAGIPDEAPPALSPLCLGSALDEMTFRSNSGHIQYLTRDANMGDGRFVNDIASSRLAFSLVLQSMVAQHATTAAHSVVPTYYPTLAMGPPASLNQHRNETASQSTEEQVRDAILHELLRRSDINRLP